MAYRLDIAEIFKVSDKIVLISGGSRGIGKMIAQTFVNNGSKVYISSRKKSDIEEAADDLNKQGPGKAIPLVADCSTEEGCKKLAEQFLSAEDRLDVLINNAGATWGHEMESHPEKAWDRCFNLNVKGVFALTKFLLPILKKTAAALPKEQHVSVINISSIAGHSISSPHIISYAASKAAVSHVTRIMAAALSKANITVNALAPGMFPSKMTAGTLEMVGGEEAYAQKEVPMGRIGRPEDLGGLAVYLAARSGGFTTGQIIAVDGATTTKIQSNF